MQLQPDRLPGPLGQAPRAEQPPARLLERVVVALLHGAGVLGTHLLAQGVQHRLQRGGAPGGQVPGDPPGAAEGGVELQAAVQEPVIAVLIGAGYPAPDLLRQLRQAGQVRAAGRRGQQDRVRIRRGPRPAGRRSSR